MSDLDTTSQFVPFTYDGATIRTIVIDGEPWFVLADLCKVLCIAEVSIVRRRLDDALCQTHPVFDSLGRTQQATIVNEPGMYEVVIRSDKPEAVTFRRWITGTVLPEIRKTGSYSTVPEIHSPEEQMALGLRAAQQLLAAKDEQLAEQAPKVELADTYLTAQGGSRLVREAAKLFGIREGELRRFLIDEKLIFAKHSPCGAVQYDHYSEFAHHFQVTETPVRHTFGTCTHYTLRILPRGMELIVKRRAAVSA